MHSCALELVFLQCQISVPVAQMWSDDDANDVIDHDLCEQHLEKNGCAAQATQPTMQTEKKMTLNTKKKDAPRICKKKR